MKTLYINCNMGAAGDMLGAALLELFPDRAAALAALNGMAIPGVEYIAESAVKCGILGTHLKVLVHGAEELPDGQTAACTAESAQPCIHAESDSHSHGCGGAHVHAHHSLIDIGAVLNALRAPEPVKSHAKAVYQSIAEAESRVHGLPVEQVHFHEVGALDAVADVAAVCLLLHLLQPDEICASPIQLGGGTVHCAHGILPVPAPATALLLEGLPVCAGAAETELCTPTGAALLRHFVTRFGAMPAMTIQAVGHGCGRKDFPTANCVTALLGESEGSDIAHPMDSVAELRCNLDDMTAEAIGYAQEILFEAGALDVFTTPIAMKKGRPATLLTVLCRPEDRRAMAALLMRHTTTLGVRESLCSRYTLRRETHTLNTEWGEVHVKTAEGWGAHRVKTEYDDLARIARKTGLPLEEVRRRIGQK